jgi:hypothetical protein
VFEVFRNMAGKKNVTCVTAIHHSLRDVNSRAGDIGLLIKIADFIDRTAVNAHAHAQLGMAFQRLRNLHRAQDWRFSTVAKD